MSAMRPQHDQIATMLISCRENTLDRTLINAVVSIAGNSQACRTLAYARQNAFRE